jgi:hypothetical protein
MIQPTDNTFADTYFVLDFDRCIGDTDKAHDVLVAVIESETNIKAAEMHKAKVAADARGYTFDTMEHVTKVLLKEKSNKTWQDILRVFVAVGQLENMLESHANELIERLEEQNIPYGILTYGSESWQLAKLEAAGVMRRNIPFEVTQIERKGDVLTGWKQGDGFVLPLSMRSGRFITARQLVFLDDKPVSFVDMPEGVRGVCVRSVAYPPRTSQQGELPPGVSDVLGIAGAIELLFGK